MSDHDRKRAEKDWKEPGFGLSDWMDIGCLGVILFDSLYWIGGGVIALVALLFSQCGRT